jgi:DNA-binding GntR family transcriptional regulator
MEATTNVEGTRPAEAVYAAIRHQILTGQRSGGEWLREEELASGLSVSRTPVREALRRLAAEGLVQHERNRGVRVASWTDQDLDEIFSLRSVLEPWASALAAGSGSAPLEELASLADQMDRAASRRAPDFDEITRLNNAFHRLVLEASGNRRLVTMLTAVVDVPLVWRTFSHYSPEALMRSLAHHHELVDALRAGDPGWAESVMRSHVRAAWSSVRDERDGTSGPSTAPAP